MAEHPKSTALDAALRALRLETTATSSASPTPQPLRVGGVDVRAIVERFGTPLYVHDPSALTDRIADVRDAFGGRAEVLFAVKANPLLALARAALGAGAGLEVASAGELLLAVTAAESLGRHDDIHHGRVHFAGPGKSADDLLLAAEHGVRVHLESPGEYERLGALGLAQMPPVGIRVNPGKPQPGAKLRMADTSSRFGIDADDVPEFARRLARDGVTIHGLHVYGGSQSFDAEAWVATAAELLALADVVEDATGKALPSLNFGGGFGWPTHEGDPPSFDLHVAGEGLQRVLDARGERATRRTSYVELGRYLCAGGGVYLTRVVDKKRSGQKTQVVLDGGMHQFGAAAGLGAVLRRCYAIVSADDVHAERSERASLGGTLCTPADRFATDVPLPPLEPGSLVAILNAGAYGLSFSPARFLGHPSPAEVVVVNGAPRLARRRGEPTDVLRDQIVDGA